MDPNLSPEILILAKASSWAFVAFLVIRQLAALQSPLACALALRFARNDKERKALVELYRIARRPLIRLPWQKHAGARHE